MLRSNRKLLRFPSREISRDKNYISCQLMEILQHFRLRRDILHNFQRQVKHKIIKTKSKNQKTLYTIYKARFLIHSLRTRIIMLLLIVFFARPRNGLIDKDHTRRKKLFLF